MYLDFCIFRVEEKGKEWRRGGFREVLRHDGRREKERVKEGDGGGKKGRYSYKART